MMIREGLELNQILIFVGCQRMERDGLTLGRKFGLFIWTPCLQLFGRVGFSSLILQLFFSKIPSLFAEMILITLEFHDEKTLYGMIGYMVETLGVWLRGKKMLGGGCQSRNGWLAGQTCEASRRWVYGGNWSADGKFYFLDGHIVRQSSW